MVPPQLSAFKKIIAMRNVCILAFLLAGLAAGCKGKDEPAPEYCWQCTETLVTTPSGSPAVTETNTEEVCNMTEEAARDYEASNTTVSYSSSGGITITYDQRTSCRR